MSEKEQLKEGWAWLSNAPKWHYFKDSRSLCGRWMYFGSEYEVGNNNSPDNCASCRKRLLKSIEDTTGSKTP